ncbi:MAG: hypothetical protein IPK19_13245 [Chloroflexi bacterium]|nr:hypothetical protein [Chloroflexota bacterium]
MEVLGVSMNSEPVGRPSPASSRRDADGHSASNASFNYGTQDRSDAHHVPAS